MAWCSVYWRHFGTSPLMCSTGHICARGILVLHTGILVSHTGLYDVDLAVMSKQVAWLHWPVKLKEWFNIQGWIEMIGVCRFGAPDCELRTTSSTIVSKLIPSVVGCWGEFALYYYFSKGNTLLPDRGVIPRRDEFKSYVLYIVASYNNSVVVLTVSKWFNSKEVHSNNERLIFFFPIFKKMCQNIVYTFCVHD